MKAFKVVTYHRESVLTRFLKDNIKHHFWSSKGLTKVKALENVRRLKTIGLTKKYRKGQVVCAKAGSCGIFCFRDRYFAETFISANRRRIGACRVIEVEGSEEIAKPIIYSFAALIWIKLLEGNIIDDWYFPPGGTIAFRKVKVLT